MALSTNFTYIVAPKGPTASGQGTVNSTGNGAATSAGISIALPSLATLAKRTGERAPLLHDVVLTPSFGTVATATPPAEFGVCEGEDGRITHDGSPPVSAWHTAPA